VWLPAWLPADADPDCGGRLTHHSLGADRRPAISSGFSTVSTTLSYLLLARSMTIPGLVAVADGERDALVLMEAPHTDAWKLRARPLQAVNLGNAVRYSAHAADRAPGEGLNSVGRLEPLPARHIDRDRFIGNQQVRHETAFSRAPATGGQMLCSSLLVRRRAGHDCQVGTNGPRPSHTERVTGIEPALSAWESVRLRLPHGLTCGSGCPRVTVKDRSSPGLIAR